MAMMPKRVKYRKSQRGRIRGRAHRANRVQFGDFGLQVLGNGRISARQIEAGRVAATHFLHREGRVYVYDGASWKPAGLQALDTVYDLWGDGTKVYAAATQDGVYCLEDGTWSPLNPPKGNTYLSICGNKDIGTFLTGRSGIVLYSPDF